jgi:exodeoxyribonuclease VII small subunit
MLASYHRFCARQDTQRGAGHLAKKKASPKSTEADQPTFEQSLEKLEQVVRQLEEGQLGLSESLQRYEEGVKHLRQCYGALEAAERRIEVLAGVDADGNPVTEPFDDAELSLDEKAAARTQRRSRSIGDDVAPSGQGEIDEQGELF